MYQLRSALRTLQTVALVVGALVVMGAPARATSDESDQPKLSHLTGIVVAVQGDILTLRLHSGSQVKVDIKAAKAAHRVGILPKGGAVTVYGTHGANGIFHVDSVGHASPDPKQWPAND